MRTYILRVENCVNQSNSTNHRPLQEIFYLLVNNSTHFQISEKIELSIELEKHMFIFSVPVYFIEEEYIIQYARSPPLQGFKGGHHG